MIEGEAVVHEIVLPVPAEQAFEMFTEPDGEDTRRTRLRLVHDRLPGDLGLLHDDGWSRFLARLAAVAADLDPGAYPAGRPQEQLAVLRRQQGPEE